MTNPWSSDADGGLQYPFAVSKFGLQAVLLRHLQPPPTGIAPPTSFGVMLDVTLLLIRNILKAALAADVLAQNLASVERVVEGPATSTSLWTGSNRCSAPPYPHTVRTPWSPCCPC